jgi:hypothetical protein
LIDEIGLRNSQPKLDGNHGSATSIELASKEFDLASSGALFLPVFDAFYDLFFC